uniref:Uncharacterized protein n=1 Tax=Arundo donax TaxID=35708 RepID=A0A0A9BUH6_ARUDO
MCMGRAFIFPQIISDILLIYN